MISVIVPVFNAENYIRRCLDSICGQTYINLEIILVNDGSTDNSQGIMLEYAHKDSRVNVISQENAGVAAARNTGLENAHGDYILYVDSDDWIEDNMVERMIELSDDADIVFCGHDNAATYEDSKKINMVEIEEWNQPRQQFEFMKHERMTGMLWNKLIKRSLTKGIVFDEKVGYGEDAQFLWNVLKRSKKMVVTNEILYHHVLEDTSISHLNFSDKKYSAIPMWEEINEDVKQNYPELLNLVKERLMCAAVFSMYEARQCAWQNKKQIKHMRAIIRKNIGLFLKSPNVSKKFKIYAIAAWMGY